MVRNASQYLQYSAEHSSNVFSGSARSQHNGDSTADRPIYNLKYPLLQRITVVWGSRAEPYSSWRLYKPPCFDCSIAGDLYLYTSNRRLVSISVMQLSCLKAYAKQYHFADNDYIYIHRTETIGHKFMDFFQCIWLSEQFNLYNELYTYQTKKGWNEKQTLSGFKSIKFFFTKWLNLWRLSEFINAQYLRASS